MKRFKKIMALVIAMAMVLTMMSMSAFAAHGDEDDKHTLTITPQNNVTAHTYQAYQIFKGVLEADQEAIGGEDGDEHPIQLNSLAWGDNVDSEKLLTTLKGDATVGSDFTDAADAADVAAILATYANDDAKMRAFAAVIGNSENEILTGTPKEGTAEAGQAVTISDLVDGYYFIKDKDETQDGESGSYTRFVLQVVGDTEVTAKDVLPDIDKDIVVEEGQGGAEDTTADTSNGSIGDKVNYKVTGTVPNMDGYESYLYEISDSMTTGLTFNDDIAVTIGENSLIEVMPVGTGSATKWYPVRTADGDIIPDTTKDPVTAGYVVTRTDARNFKVYIINFIQYNTEDMIGEDIVVTYSATINENAVIDTAEKNTAKLKYSNNPNQSDKGDNGEPDSTNPTGQGPDKDTTTFTTGLELLKYDAQDNTKTLAGAAFTITGDAQNIAIVNETKYALDATNGTYYLLKDGTYTNIVPGSTVEGKVVSADDYVSTTDKYAPVTTVTKVYNGSETSTAGGVTESDGVYTATGLGEGLYTITETQAPTGYNLLANPIYVYVKFIPNEDNIEDSEFKIYQYKDSATAPTVDDETNFDESEDWTLLTNTNESESILFDIDVPNNSGSELPSTGGIGTTIFYVVGAILVLGAGVVLITRRRMDA